MSIKCFFGAHKPQVSYEVWRDLRDNSTKCAKHTDCVRCGKRIKSEKANYYAWVKWRRREMGEAWWVLL